MCHPYYHLFQCRRKAKILKFTFSSQLPLSDDAMIFSAQYDILVLNGQSLSKFFITSCHPENLQFLGQVDEKTIYTIFSSKREHKKILLFLLQMEIEDNDLQGNLVPYLMRQQYQSMSKASKKSKQLQIQEVKMLLHRRRKFYLVGITGRTSFILENLQGTKFKITIGNELKCSCQTANNRQCVHTLYVLTDIFYIPEDHPLLFRHTYDDKELRYSFHYLRYIIASRRIHDNKVQDFLKYTKIKIPRRNVIVEEDEDEDEDNLCAICHMQIVKCDATTTCATVCKNTFHLDCFSQWAKHELKNNGVVKCPLCRDQKTPDIIRQIRQKEYMLKDQLINKKVGKEYNYYCDGCQLRELCSNETVYKCVHCQDVTLCDNCFKLGRHMKHSFICKSGSQKKWRQCQDRKLKKKMDSDQGFIRTKLKNIRRFSNFLAATLPCFFSKNTRWNIIECKKLDIKIEELECIMCSDKQKAFLRKLSCGHFIHHRCLRKRIEKGKFYCKLDGQKYLLGYEALLKHELLNKKTLDIDEREDSEEEQEEKDERKSPLKMRTSSKVLRTEKSTTSCDSRKKPKKGKHSIEDRNKSLTSKFMNNPE